MEEGEKDRIKKSINRHAQMPEYLIEMLMAYNKEVGDKETFDKLDKVLDEKIRQESEKK